jgi:hypothetical protein
MKKANCSRTPFGRTAGGGEIHARWQKPCIAAEFSKEVDAIEPDGTPTLSEFAPLAMPRFTLYDMIIDPGRVSAGIRRNALNKDSQNSGMRK